MFKFNGFQKALAWIFLLLLAFANLYPIGIMMLSSFKSTKEIFLEPFSLPSVWRWQNYVSAWQRADFATYFKNSVLVTALSIVSIIIVSSMAAYVIARFDFKFKRGIYLYMLAGLALPTRLAIIPIFLIMRNLHLLDKLSGLVVVYTASGIAFGGLGASQVGMGLGATVVTLIFLIVLPVSIFYVFIVEKRVEKGQ